MQRRLVGSSPWGHRVRHNCTDHTHTHAQIRKLSLKETEVLPPRSRSLTMLVPDLNSSLLNSKDCVINPPGTLTVLKYP